MRFEKWLDTLIEEKGYDLNDYIELDRGIEVDGFYTRHISLELAVEKMKGQSLECKKMIKDKLVRVDFKNGDCYACLEYLYNTL